MDVIAKGKNNFQLKCLFFLKNQKEIPETTMFKTNADGFITLTGIAKRAIRARYPLAPPCPTLAYINETASNIRKNGMTICNSKKPIRNLNLYIQRILLFEFLYYRPEQLKVHSTL